MSTPKLSSRPMVALLASAVVGAFLVAGCAGGASKRAERAHAPPTGRPAAPMTPADPAFIEQWAATYRFSLGRPTAIKPTPDGSAVLFLRSGPRSQVRDLYEFDCATGQERLLLTADQILQGGAEKLTAEELARRERMRLTARGVAGYELSQDGSKVLVNLSGRIFVVTRADGAARELKSDNGYPIDARFSPDGTMVSCVREGEVYVTDIGSGQERRITSGAGGTITNGLAEFVAQEEMDRREGYWWSPDSKQIAYQQTDTAGMEVMHIMDATHPEAAPAEWPYPRPGKQNARVRLGVVPAAGGQTTWVSWDPGQYEYLATVKWTENAPLTVVLQNRSQTEEGVFAVDTSTGYLTELLLERDTAWLNLDQRMPRWLKDGSGFLWTTERNGAWQVELRGRDGGLKRAVTPPTVGMREFVDVDEASGTVWFIASTEPTEAHLFRAPLDPSGGAPEQLTRRPGVHSAVFSKDHSVYVHTESTFDGQDSATVRRANGDLIGRLTSKAEEPPFQPSVTLVKVGTNPEFNCAVVRPRNFNPLLSYPVINSVYGGPHVKTVTASRRAYLLQQWMADQGFIVVSIDARGTPGRGRAWERATKGDLIALPMQDQAAAMQMLARRYREMDLSRAGIFGWSFGGYFSAMAAMMRPDVFAAAVAGAPVTDWLDYDTHYTERYMGLPADNATGYRDTSALTHAGQLTVPLLVIHGTADDNVYFMHSLKLMDALLRSGGADHADLLPLIGFTHMVPDPAVMRRLYTRVMEQFTTTLAPGGAATPASAARAPAAVRGIEERAVRRTLDALHTAAATADAPAYWSLYAPDAIFLGTDPTERWTIEQFHAYADPHFKGPAAWTYTPGERHVSISDDGSTAWFDERLQNTKLGECRGTGVLTRTGASDWKIEQYNLTIPIPNDATPDVVKTIRAWQAAQPTPTN